MKTKSIPLKLPSIPITIIRLLLLGISFLVLQTLEAQCYTDFKYAIGTPGADEAFDIVNAGNGDFFVVGTTVETVSGKNVLVTKMNSGGAIIWTKVYGGTGTETVKKASATHDNGLLITGSTGSFTNTKGDIMCLKIDKNGNLIWLRKFGANSATGDLGMDITETNDGGYAVVGVLNALSSDADMIVLKLDVNANIIWSKRFDEGVIENGIGILENANNLIVTSEILTPGADYDGIITELDEINGNINVNVETFLIFKSSRPLFCIRMIIDKLPKDNTSLLNVLSYFHVCIVISVIVPVKSNSTLCGNNI